MPAFVGMHAYSPARLKSSRAYRIARSTVAPSAAWRADQVIDAITSGDSACPDRRTGRTAPVRNRDGDDRAHRQSYLLNKLTASGQRLRAVRPKGGISGASAVCLMLDMPQRGVDCDPVLLPGCADTRPHCVPAGTHVRQTDRMIGLLQPMRTYGSDVMIDTPAERDIRTGWQGSDEGCVSWSPGVGRRARVLASTAAGAAIGDLQFPAIERNAQSPYAATATRCRRRACHTIQIMYCTTVLTVQTYVTASSIASDLDLISHSYTQCIRPHYHSTPSAAGDIRQERSRPPQMA